MRHSLINLLATWVLLLIAVHAFAQEPDSARNVSYINRMITIGETYQNAGNLDKARHFYQNALQSATNLFDRWRSVDHFATVCALMNRKSEAFSTYENFLNTPEVKADTTILAYTYDGIGCICFLNGEYVKSVKYLELAEKFSGTIHHDVHFRAKLKFDHGRTRLVAGDIHTAEEYLLFAEKLVNETHDYLSHVELYGVFAQLYRKMGNYEKALHYADLYRQYHDTKMQEQLHSLLISTIDIEEDNTQKLNIEQSASNELQKRLWEYTEKNHQMGVMVYVSLCLALFMVVCLVVFIRFNNRYKKRIRILNKQFHDIARVSAATSNELVTTFGNIIDESNLQIQYAAAQDDADKLAYSSNIYKSTLQSFQSIINILYWVQLTEQIRTNIITLHVSFEIENLVDLCRYYAESKGVNLNVDIGDNAEVLCDRVSFAIILHNILINAIKYTASGGRVTITDEVTHDMVYIYVEDTGIGMTRETIAKINGDTYTSSTVGTNNERGFGIGLLVCRKIIKINHGELKIESERGLGTKVCFGLPNKNKPKRDRFI
ncbi:MAG: tetratricopeptide repeat-containing sensor histidine kinase [Bacteroidales bacterium]|nr:tetratricopeptide repeat-containing sensor histidine kinase [Bacteroidales bacterium]